MKDKTECTWCEKEFEYEDSEEYSFEDIRWIDEDNPELVVVYYVMCPYCNQNTETWW